MTAEATKENIFLRADRAGSDKRRFWIYIVLFFIVWATRATVLYRIDLMITPDVRRNVYSNAVKCLIWVLPAFAFLRFTGEEKPLRYLKLTTVPDKRGLPIASVVTVLYFSLVVIVESAVRGKSPMSLLAAPVSMLLLNLAGGLISPLVEEIMFRGFVLGKLSEWSRFWRANLIASLLFSLAHWPYWLWSRMPMLLFTRNVVNVFLLGLLFGWLVNKTNSLWPAVGAHVINNFLAGLINR